MVPFLLIGLAARASAGEGDDAPGHVLVVRTGHEPACLDLAAVARAVGRHAARAAVVVDADARVDATDTTVRLSADGDTVVLTLARSGRLVSQELAIAPCETLPEQVGAFVASTLATPPDASGASETPARASRLPSPQETAANAEAASADAAELEAARRRRVERAALLAEVVDDGFIRPTQNGLAWAGVGTALLTGGSTALVFAIDGANDSARALAASGTAITVLGSVGVEALGDSNAAEPLFWTTSMIGLGLVSMAMGDLGGNDIKGPYYRPGGFILGAAYVTAGLGYGIQRLRRPNVASWRVRRHLERIATPAARDAITDEQLAAIEDDVAAGSTPFEPWMRATPFALAAGLSLALIPRYENNQDELIDLMVFGFGFNTLLAVTLAATPTPIERYHHRLHAAGLDLHVAPASGGAMVGLSGTF